MLRTAYYGTLRALGLPSLVSRLRTSAVILAYHNVWRPSVDTPAAGEPGVHLPLADFTAQLAWLRRRATVVPLDELVDRARRARTLARLAALTFDDGYAGVFEHALPVLRSLALPATVFVVSHAAEHGEAFWWDGRPALPDTHRPASWTAVEAAAAAGLAVGAHSVTHRTLTVLDDATLDAELRVSRDAIAARTGVRPEYFAYPYGAWNTRVRDAAERAGYRGALTLEPRAVRPGADPYALPRINVPAGISLPAYQGWVAGLRPSFRRGA